MEELSGNHLGNELLLWHGSPSFSNIISITTQGFDIRVSNTAGALGAGTYFSATAAYSDTYSRRNGGAPTTGLARVLKDGALSKVPPPPASWPPLQQQHPPHNIWQPAVLVQCNVRPSGAASPDPAVAAASVTASSISLTVNTASSSSRIGGSSSGTASSSGASSRNSGAFANNYQRLSRVSAASVGARTDNNETGRYAMLLCRVALGRIGKGSSSLRKPPHGCDAVSNSGNQVASESDMFAVFDNSQAYPEWIVYYD